MLSQGFWEKAIQLTIRTLTIVIQTVAGLGSSVEVRIPTEIVVVVAVAIVVIVGLSMAR